jgi:predicted HAD superfamily phosphohydrolase
VMPAEENPAQFVRRVTPGDHLEKLDAATIAALDDILHEELRRFGYAPGTGAG